MPFETIKTFCGALLFACAGAVFAACGGGSWLPSTTPNGAFPALTDGNVEFSLAAGMTQIAPDATGTVSPSVDLGRFGLPGFDRVYEVTTPVGEDFGFTLVARSPGNSGDTRISVGHAADGGATPNGGAETIAGAGMVVEGPGLSYDNSWVNANGDGFTRITVTGKVDQDQVLVARVPQPDNKPDEVVGIRVAIGPESAINQSDVATNPAAPKNDQIIFSSDAYQFGLPAIGVNGDRYSIATYDGNSDDAWEWTRTRRWLQYDPATHVTTGGQASAAGNDLGSWRNQEIAGHENVVAIVSTGGGTVDLNISLDRGVTFPISQVLSEDSFGWGQRLVNIAISDEYKIGVIYWESSGADFNSLQTKLKLVEGVPSGFDLNNTPSGYTFAAPSVVKNPMRNVTPLLMQLAYSSAEDLVIGYGFTTLEAVAAQPFATSTASFRCAIRMAGETAFNDVLVDQEVGIMPMDPSVGLRGAGPTMQVFFAYERTDGVYLAYSTNAGSSFANVTKTGAAGAFMPSVHVRDQAGMTRVDLLYINPSAKGLELHDLRWGDFDPSGAGATLESLTTATRVESTDDTGANLWLPFAKTIEIHDLAWFGFDAVTNGDDVAIVVHEHDRTSFDFMNLGRPFFIGGEWLLDGASGAPQAGAAAVLLPGLMDPVAAPNPAHRNQLRLIVLD